MTEKMVTITNTTAHEVWVVGSESWSSDLICTLQRGETVTVVHTERTTLLAVHGDGSPALVEAVVGVPIKLPIETDSLPD